MRSVPTRSPTFLLLAFCVLLPFSFANTVGSFPLRVVKVDANAVKMEPVPALLEVLESRHEVLFENVMIGPNRTVDMELRRVHVVDNGAVFAVDGFVNPTSLDDGLTLWTGSVVGDPGSSVFLAFSPHGSRGFFTAHGQHMELAAAGVRGKWSKTVSYMRKVDPSSLPAAADYCAAEQLQEFPTIHTAAKTASGKSSGGFAYGSAPLPYLNLNLALETDYQFYQLFNDIDATRTYAVTLLGAVSDRYREQAGVIITLPYLGLYSTNTDPWTTQDQGGDCIAALYEFRDAWKNGNGPLTADLYHLLSGANLGCGVAWLDVLCHQEYGFSLSGNMGGGTQFPVAQGNSGNWDFLVVAHELGHNFGSPHTHDFCPPLDECAPSDYFGSCQNNQNCISNGTVMGYCHLCSGGLNNVTMYFHPTVVGVVRAGAEASCLQDYVGLAINDDLGYEKAGSNGDPSLEVAFDASSFVLSFEVAQGPSSQVGLLIISYNALFAPFLGGVLVPDVQVVVPVTTSATGGISLGAPLPGGISLPTGLLFYSQAWFNDPSGPTSYSATNGVLSELIIP